MITGCISNYIYGSICVNKTEINKITKVCKTQLSILAHGSELSK